MPCRLCTANDEQALIEQTAAGLWESRRTGHVHDVPWEQAGDHRQRVFRELATSATEGLRSEHWHH